MYSYMRTTSVILSGLVDGMNENILGHLKVVPQMSVEEFAIYKDAFTKGVRYTNWMWELENDRI